MIGESSPSSYNTSVAMEFFRFAGKPKAFAKGRKIFSENQKGSPFLLMPNRMYLLLDGEVGIFSREKPVATVRPGQIFGEMASIDQGPRTGTAVTKSACRVIALDNRQLQKALGKYPEFSLMLMSVMIGRLRESINRLAGPGSPVTGIQRRESAPLRKDLIDDLERARAVYRFALAVQGLNSRATWRARRAAPGRRSRSPCSRSSRGSSGRPPICPAPASPRAPSPGP